MKTVCVIETVETRRAAIKRDGFAVSLSGFDIPIILLRSNLITGYHIFLKIQRSIKKFSEFYARKELGRKLDSNFRKV